MNHPPLNPDEIRAAALANRHAILDEEFWGFSSESDAQDYGFEQGAKWAQQRLTAALPEVTSVEQWDSLPIGTMVRVHFNGNSELIIRCPAGSGAGIGGMSFIGGRHWSDVFTVWNADKLEIKYIPEVRP